MRRRELYDVSSGIAGPHLLPRTTPEGKPCYLSTNGTGYLTGLADSVETVRLDMGEELLTSARDILAPGAKAVSGTD
jgi:hypothetical protein